MKIGITCYPTYGGSGVVATELGKELAKNGHEIHFICYEVPFRLREYQERIFFHEVEMLLYPLFKYPPYTLALTAKMAEVAEEENLDLLHVHYAIPHAVCGYLVKQMLSRKIKIITTLHGTDITLVGANRSFFSITKFAIESSDGITAVSDFLKWKTVEEFCINCNVKVIPNFVDTQIFNGIPSRSCDRKHFAQDGEKILMHVSNFRKTKRVVDVVKIFERVRRDFPCILILIGDGPEMPSVVEEIKKNSLEKEIFLLGKQDYLENLLPFGDIFLIPSESESFGLAALEAMSCGLPVVGSNIGGLPEVVKHGENGFLAEVGDIEKMAEYTIKILSDEDLKRRFKNSSRERAVKFFDCRDIVPKYEEYYEEILKK